ncbi:oligosaccharide flippase family protein [Ferrimonas pelagia]|uniref:Oligosaccharide flippase family protein n=1 Tax=Ferrimonas pelagia TaxID=1177826 RepID=A0ABP9EEV2_9GAMM
MGEIIKGGSVALILKVVAAGCAFLLNIVIARQLGVEQAGYYFLSLSAITLLATLGLLGFDNALVRFISSYNEKGNEHAIAQVYTLALSRVIPALLVIVSIAIYFVEDIALSVFSKPELADNLCLMLIASIPLSICLLHGFAFQGKKMVAMSVSSQSLLVPLGLLLVLFFFPSVSAEGLAYRYLAISCLVAVFVTLYWHRTSSPTTARPTVDVKALIVPTLPSLFVIVFVGQSLQWGSQLLVGAIASAQDVAIFASAQRTAMLTSFILIAVNAIAAPKFAASYEKGDMAMLRQTAILSGRLMTIVAVPALCVMWFGAEFIMSWFGDDFREGALVLRILAVGQFINVITGSVGYLLQMTGNERFLRNNLMFAFIFMVIGLPLAIPLFGVVGAATVTSISVGLQNLLSVFFVNRQLGFNTLRIFSR